MLIRLLRKGLGCGLVVECLPSMHKAQGSIPSTKKKVYEIKTNLETIEMA